MTRKFNSVLFCFIITLFASSFFGVQAQNPIKYTVTSSDCKNMVVQFTCKNSYKWEIIDKKLNAKKTQFVDTLVVIEGAAIKHTFTHGYYSVKAYYKDNFGEAVEAAADTTITFAPYADFQVTQEDAAAANMVTVKVKALDVTPLITYEWTIDKIKKTGNVYSLNEGLHSVKLVTTLITTSGTCKDSITSNVIVVRSQMKDISTAATNKIDSVSTYPNVFSPNGDGINDVFYIPTPIKSYKENDVKNEYTLEVYNRGGMLVYKSVSPIVQWDGNTLDGKPVKPGQYFYTLKLNNTPLPSKGKAVHLLMIYN